MNRLVPGESALTLSTGGQTLVAAAPIDDSRMSTIVKASLPTDQFAMAETFEVVPDVTVDAVRFVSHASDQAMPLLWTMGADAETVRAAMEADETTADVHLVSQRNHDSLFRLRWTDQIRFITHVLVEKNGAVVSAHGESDEWTFRILFPERDGVSATFESCGEYDVSIDRIQTLDEVASSGRRRLTETQSETLETALESGYYGVPRGVTIDELATELGVSHQALSERFRRGHRTLVQDLLSP